MPSNEEIAQLLLQGADLYEQQGDNPFRVAAYRQAAETLSGLDRSAEAIVAQHGVHGLVQIRHIGEGIARAIYEIVATGRWSQLDRLRGTLDPLQLFQLLPGVGHELARRIHDELAVDTLEALEAAAYDGRLQRLRGFGPRRVSAIRIALDSLLRRRRLRRPADPATGPTVADVLAADVEYRSKAESGQLPTIAPKRFNPERVAWLPILHTRRGAWHFTALFSNTERAHRLGHTSDWVVVYYYDGDHREAQCTVVTETRGGLAGRRVIRGREPDCRRYYADRATRAPDSSSTTA